MWNGIKFLSVYKLFSKFIIVFAVFIFLISLLIRNIIYAQTKICITGDANCDGVINWTDYNIWTNEFISKIDLTSDFNGDSKITLVDYEIWRKTSLIPTPATSIATTVSNIYKDGTYSANGSYDTPAGSEIITVTMTILNDKVNAVSVVATPSTDSTSKYYIGKFNTGIGPLVIGQSLDNNFNYTVVNGASLTIVGFRDAVYKNSIKNIRQLAQV